MQRSVDDLADQLIGHGVVVPVELDVVVDVDLGRAPGRELVARRAAAAAAPGGRAVRTELARAVHLLERSGVDHRDALADRDVRLGERGEPAVAQPGDDPALGQQHPRFDLGLVAGLVGPRRDDGDPVVGGHLLIGGVHVGLVAVRLGDARAEVVADHDLVTAPHRLEGVHVRATQCISSWEGSASA